MKTICVISKNDNFMRLVQNVQIVIILRDILINFPDFIETLTMTMTMTMTNLTEHILSPLVRGGSKAGIFNEGRKTKDEERKTEDEKRKTKDEKRKPIS